MKQLISLIVIFLMISCTDQNLVKKNEELLQLTQELKEEVESQRGKAIEAAAEAFRMQQVAELNAEEARRMAVVGEEEVEKLRKQLEECQ